VLATEARTPVQKNPDIDFAGSGRKRRSGLTESCGPGPGGHSRSGLTDGTCGPPPEQVSLLAAVVANGPAKLASGGGSGKTQSQTLWMAVHTAKTACTLYGRYTCTQRGPPPPRMVVRGIYLAPTRREYRPGSPPGSSGWSSGCRRKLPVKKKRHGRGPFGSAHLLRASALHSRSDANDSTDAFPIRTVKRRRFMQARSLQYLQVG
jgi:hypothetical protein